MTTDTLQVDLLRNFLGTYVHVPTVFRHQEPLSLIDRQAGLSSNWTWYLLTQANKS